MQQVGRAHAAQIGHQAKGIGIADVERLAVGDRQGKACARQQITCGAHVDQRMNTLRYRIAGGLIRRQQRLLQPWQATRSDEARQKQSVRLERTTALDQRAGQVVDAVEYSGRNDQIETFGCERQPILIALDTAGGEARTGIGGDDLDIAAAQRARHRTIPGSKIERMFEATRHQVEPVEQSLDDGIAQEAILAEPIGGAIPPHTALASVKDFRRFHGGGLVPARSAADKRGMSLLPIPRMLRLSLRGVVAFALPPRCPGCGTVAAEDHVFCLACWQALDFLGGPACGQCGEPIELAYHDDARCGACLADPPPFDRARAAVAYGPIARALALKLKYGRRPGIAQTMARPMRRVGGAMLDGALIAPVPLHRRRLWSRGYNQAALIARALARDGTGELALDLIDRLKATPPLRGLGRLARERTVAGAFRLDPKWAQVVKGRRVVLIDDVYTTGSTVRGCARVLKRAGAGEVNVLCWARVLRDQEEMR